MSQEVKDITNTYEQEIKRDMTASKKGISIIDGLTGEESKRVLKSYYSKEEQRLRSLALKQLEDIVKQIKGEK